MTSSIRWKILINVDTNEVINMVRAFDYGECDSAPFENLDANIKGIELEIKSNSDYEDALYNLIRDEYLINDYDYMEQSDDMFLEYDGSVDYEIKMRANKNNVLLRNLKTLNNFGLNPEELTNKSGTSCHIHLNNNYLSSLDLGQLDMVKVGEFFGNILFQISGREMNDYNDWCRSALQSNFSFDILDKDINKKAKLIDNDLLNANIDGKYRMINIEHFHTTEFRIFSNKCSFDFNTIEMFIGFCDHMIDVADFMNEKRYSNNIDILVDWTKDWFKSTNFRDTILSSKLANYLLSSEEVKIIQRKNIENIFNCFNNHSFDSDIEKTKEFIRILRKLDKDYDYKFDGDINICNTNYESILNNILDDII